MSPGRDTDPTPLGEPPPLPPIPRAKRSTVGTIGVSILAAVGRAVVAFFKALEKNAGKAAVAVVLAFVTLLTYWTQKIGSQANSAKDVAVEARGAAEVATAQGATGTAAAIETKVENQAGYTATKSKVDATGDLTAELVAEVKAMRAELDRMKSTPRRRPRSRAAAEEAKRKAAEEAKRLEVVKEPLPETPKAAAKVAPPTPGGPP